VPTRRSLLVARGGCETALLLDISRSAGKTGRRKWGVPRGAVGPENMKAVAIALTALLLMTGCSDTVRTEFATLSAAKEAGAFNRGWLPPALPDGATQIAEINDLDINSGKGTFRFPADSTVTYLETMRTGFNATVTRSSVGITVDVTNDTTRWSVHLDPNKGRGKYSVRTTK
jgi:hypothetical protein